MSRVHLISRLAILAGCLLLPSRAQATEKANALTISTNVPKDEVIPHKEWAPYTGTLELRHAVLGLWNGTDTWVLLFTNGTGDDACAELTQPTGDQIITLVLPGPVGKEQSASPLEPTRATIYYERSNTVIPLEDMDAKQIRFAASEGGKGTVVRGRVDIRGEFFSVPYQISGPFEVLRCQ